MNKTMKHVKLFENWARENIGLPEYLDPDVHEIGRFKTLYHPEIMDKIKNPPDNVLDLSENTSRVNFKSFSDYDFWKGKYQTILINQSNVEYRLEDCFGIPENDIFTAHGTYIKSLNGAGVLKFTRVGITASFLENLKYCPASLYYEFDGNPLLSYYNTTASSVGVVVDFFKPMCGGCYKKEGYESSNLPSSRDLKNPKFNADIFCHFKDVVYRAKMYKSREIVYNPWINIYEDPNEVEDYEFLFMPFYDNSEKFRDKAKEYLPNIDLSGVTIGRTDLW